MPNGPAHFYKLPDHSKNSFPVSAILSISLVEDDGETLAFWRRSFARQPDFTVVGCYPSAPAALAGLAQRRSTILLADWHMPGGNGIELIAEVRRQSLADRCILATGYDLEHLPAEALRCGAAGFIYKFELPLQLPRRVREIFAGKGGPSPLVAQKIAATLQAEAAASEAFLRKLTERERNVLLACRTGRPEKQVADEQGISPNTLRNHLHNAYGKLGVHGLLEAVQLIWPAPAGPSPTPAKLPPTRAPRPPRDD